MRIILCNGQATVTDGELDLNAAGHYRLRPRQLQINAARRRLGLPSLHR
jgi:hypothetical protein